MWLHKGFDPNVFNFDFRIKYITTLLFIKSWNLFWLESNWLLTELKEFNTSTNFWGVEMCKTKYLLFWPLFFLAVFWILSINVIYLFSYYKLCLSIIWQTVGVQYKYAFDVRYSQCGRTVSEGADFFMYLYKMRLLLQNRFLPVLKFSWSLTR